MSHDHATPYALRTSLTLAAAALLAVASTGLADDWPQWRGPDRTDRSAETGLLKAWPDGGPKLVWHIDKLGKGYAGPAIADGRMYIMSDRGQGEQLHCLDASSGRELWSTNVGPYFQNQWGDGPRSTPTVDGDRVYVMGSLGDLACINTKTGKTIWSHNLGKIGGNWGYTQSPLVDGNKVIAAGRKTKPIVALDKMTGKVIWETKSGFDSALHYSSMIAVDHKGVRQIIQLRSEEVLGLRASDGEILWKAPWHGRTAVIPTPIYKDGYVYIASGYGQGCMLLNINGPEPKVVYDNRVMINHHGGVILVGDHLYGHSDREGWVCQDFMTGKIVWQHKARDIGKGSCTYADGMLYLLQEKPVKNKGLVVLAEASPKAWNETGRFTLPAGTKFDDTRQRGKIWVHPVVANGKLYLRDQEHVFCYDVKK